MNKYNMEYDPYSLFLRFKSNEKYKERIGSITKRKNLFLPEIKNKTNVSKSKHTSVLDLEKSYEINVNNRRLFDRLDQIKSKNKMTVLKTESNVYTNHVDHQKIYNTIQRQINFKRIKDDNQRLNLRILKR